MLFFKCETLSVEIVYLHIHVYLLIINIKRQKEDPLYALSYLRLKREQLNIYFRGETIFRVNSTNFLGVIIDDKLKWTAHIQYIKNKLSKSIGIMYKCRNYFDKETMRNLYFSFIYPYLTYCVEIWGNACNIHLDPIVKLKKMYSYYNILILFRTHTTLV